MNEPILWIIIPCYNEEEVLPITAPMFLKKVQEMISEKLIGKESRILFVDDGSTDKTWSIIRSLAENNSHYTGIALSRNRGHQNALLAGLMESIEHCDITISIDCDGQDDINVMENMVQEYQNGYEIVYGVRSDRSTDTPFKRWTAQGFYKLIRVMGAEIVYNHADYRLVSTKALQHFSDFHEVNLFLRGLFPLVGFKSTKVYYERSERIIGESHYPLKKMVSLAIDGITSLSIKPIRIVTSAGVFIGTLGLLGVIWAIIRAITGKTTDGWASLACISCFLGGVQLFSIGVIGEYIGKTYLETKQRPRYIISEKTWDSKTNNR